MIDFKTALRRLQEHCPLAEPFAIIAISKENNFGTSHRNKNIFVLEIAIDVDEITRIDTLIHEWAHGLRVVKAPHGGHDSSWGIEFARCHRAVWADTSEDDDTRAMLPSDVKEIVFLRDEKYNIPELRVKR